MKKRSKTLAATPQGRAAPRQPGGEAVKRILCSYTPICTSLAGREAAAKYNIPPYADASCRREPDLEHDYPSITSTCRKGKLIMRLAEGDVVVYITKQGRYPGMAAPAWRLTAILRVKQICDSHKEAAAWYRKRELRLPYNCIHRRPLPEAQTARIYNTYVWPYCTTYDETVINYAGRIDEYPRFIITEWLYRELANPPLITRDMMLQVFNNTIPGTQNPRNFREAEYPALLKKCGIRERRI